MKKNNSNLIILSMVFAVSLVISNVVTAKLFDTGIKLFGQNVIIPGAAVCYAITFLSTDIISEIWGKKEADRIVLFGIIAQILATILIIFTQKLPAADPDMQNAYVVLLGQNWVFVLGSLIAYFCSQTWDVMVFHKLMDVCKGKHKWIRNNLSTMTSQIIDTVIFIGIAFGFGFGWFFDPAMHGALINMFIGQYVFKFILALLDTPIFYLLTRNSQEANEKKYH